MTRGEAVSDAQRRLATAGIPPAEARTEAVLLLRHTTGISREELLLRPDMALTNHQAEQFQAAVERRADREPLAYITGTRDFYGLTFTVTPAVLIPRPETEGVVEAVLEAVPTNKPGARILDLCTGSGAIAVAVAVHRPQARIVATDLSTDALRVAHENANRYGVAERVSFLTGDLFSAVSSETRFAVIASNPPYIGPDEIEKLEPEVRDFEPRIALGVHPDALRFYRRIASESTAFLLPDGVVIVEVGQGQAEPVCELFRAAGFIDVHALPDLAGILRVVIASQRKLVVHP